MINEQAARLKLFMEKYDITQSELVSATKKPQSTISKYLSGDLRIPSEVANVLHTKYHLNFNWFYAGTGRKKYGQPDKRELMTDISDLRVEVKQLRAKLQHQEAVTTKLVEDFYAFRNESNTQKGHNH